MIFITHNMGLVKKVADELAVMYAGEIVEQASREQFFKAPKHPYSIKLFNSLPKRSKRNQRLEVIQGFVPSLATEFKGCRFEPRCEYAIEACKHNIPAWLLLDDSEVGVRCHRFDPKFKEQFNEPTQSASGTVSAAEAIDLRAGDGWPICRSRGFKRSSLSAPNFL